MRLIFADSVAYNLTEPNMHILLTLQVPHVRQRAVNIDETTLSGSMVHKSYS
jgi:hypothetical protein